MIKATDGPLRIYSFLGRTLDKQFKQIKPVPNNTEAIFLCF